MDLPWSNLAELALTPLRSDPSVSFWFLKLRTEQNPAKRLTSRCCHGRGNRPYTSILSTPNWYKEHISPFHILHTTNWNRSWEHYYCKDNHTTVLMNVIESPSHPIPCNRTSRKTKQVSSCKLVVADRLPPGLWRFHFSQRKRIPGQSLLHEYERSHYYPVMWQWVS